MKNQLTILFPTGSFYPAQTGGPDNTVYWITKALTRRGHRAIIPTTDRGLDRELPRNQWLYTDYGNVNYTRNPIHYFPLSVLWQAFRRLRSVDVLHLSMITYPASFLLGIINSWTYRKPMLWSTHGDLDPPMLLRSRKKKRFVLWLINNFVSKNRLWFHATCDAECAYIRQNFGPGARIVQIPNYMELPTPVSVEKSRYFLYIGRIDPKKAIENLIEALDRSARFRTGPFTLKIVGDAGNPYGESLRRQVSGAGLAQKVEFLGHREGEEKQRLLAGAHFLLMPSHTENFGIVVTEALAQGTPALASTGTPWRVLQDRDAGVWVDNDPETLLDTIDRLQELSVERREELGQNALRLAEEEYSIHSRVGEWETAYRSLLL